jgi:hypothetical protein
MSNHRGSSGAFNSSFARRPYESDGSGGAGSLLGDPPRRQQQQQLYDPFAESELDSGRSYGRSGSVGDGYGRQGSNDYASGTYSSSGTPAAIPSGYGQSGRSGYGGQGQTSSSAFSTPSGRARESSYSTGGQDTWRKRSPSPPHHHVDYNRKYSFYCYRSHVTS